MSDIRQMKLMSGEEILCDLVDVQKRVRGWRVLYYTRCLSPYIKRRLRKTICGIIHSDRL